jgi:hypothetical protein
MYGGVDVGKHLCEALHFRFSDFLGWWMHMRSPSHVLPSSGSPSGMPSTPTRGAAGNPGCYRLVVVGLAAFGFVMFLLAAGMFHTPAQPASLAGDDEERMERRLEGCVAPHARANTLAHAPTHVPPHGPPYAAFDAYVGCVCAGLRERGGLGGGWSGEGAIPCSSARVSLIFCGPCQCHPVTSARSTTRTPRSPPRPCTHPACMICAAVGGCIFIIGCP